MMYGDATDSGFPSPRWVVGGDPGLERGVPGAGRSVSQSKLREPLTPTLSPTGRGGAGAVQAA
jgi:hypothetical protein